MQTGVDGDTGSGSDDTILKKPVLAALAAIGLAVILAAAAMGAGTTIGPTGVNFTSGDLSGVGSLDGGGNAISVSDSLDLNGNEVTDSPVTKETAEYVLWNDGGTYKARNTTGHVQIQDSSFDTVAENAVSNASDNGGGIVYFSPGTYQQDGDITVKTDVTVYLSDGVTLNRSWNATEPQIQVAGNNTAVLGQGVIDGNRDLGYHGTFKHCIHIRQDDPFPMHNILVKDVKCLQAAQQGVTATGKTDTWNVRVENVEVIRSSEAGLILGNYLRDSEFVDNRVIEPGHTGIDFWQAEENNKVIGNYVEKTENMDGMGISLTNSETGSYFGNITDGKVLNNHVIGSTYDCINVMMVERVEVAGNVCEGAGREGIRLNYREYDGTRYYASEINVHDNYIRNSSNNGIHVYGVKRSIIGDNYIVDSQNNGIVVDNGFTGRKIQARVIGNTVVNSSQTGVDQHDHIRGNNIEDAVIAENVLIGEAAGSDINITGGASKNNVLRSNYVRDNGISIADNADSHAVIDNMGRSTNRLTGDLNMTGNSINELNSVDNGGDTITFNDNIDVASIDNGGGPVNMANGLKGDSVGDNYVHFHQDSPSTSAIALPVYPFGRERNPYLLFRDPTTGWQTTIGADGRQNGNDTNIILDRNDGSSGDQFQIMADGTDQFEADLLWRVDDAGTVDQQGDLNMNGNNISSTQMHNMEQTSGDLPTCDSSLSGAVMYNGSGHWGCHSSSWNPMY